MDEQMLEQTTPTTETTATEDFDLFDDDIPTETNEEVTEDTTNTTDTQEVQTDTTEKPTTHKVKYNGQEIELSLEELITNAQKGMNYDHVKAERDKFVGKEDAISELEYYANQSGMTVAEYTKSLREAREQSEVDNLIAEGNTEASAKELIRLKNLESKVLAEKAAKDADEAKSAQKKADADKDYNTFLDLYKDVDLKTIPQEVWDNANKLNSLVTAYQQYELTQLKKENEALKTNQSNKEKSVGSVKSDASTDDNDPWAVGFEKARMKG